MINLYRDPNGEKVIVHSTPTPTSQFATGNSEINTLRMRVKELELKLAGSGDTALAEVDGISDVP